MLFHLTVAIVQEVVDQPRREDPKVRLRNLNRWLKVREHRLLMTFANQDRWRETLIRAPIPWALQGLRAPINHYHQKLYTD